MKNKLIFRFSSKEISFLVIYCILQICAVVGIILTYSNKNLRLLVAVSFMNVIMCTISISVLIKIVKSIIERNNDVEKIKEYEEKLQESIRIFKLVENQNIKVRKFYHDFSNHCAVIRSLHEMGELEEERNYINCVRQEYTKNIELPN